jgi:hypothetical protein
MVVGSPDIRGKERAGFAVTRRAARALDSRPIARSVAHASIASRSPMRWRRIVVLPTSLVVAIVTVAMTLVPAVVLFWAWRRGLFSDLEAQSRVIFEPRDWRVRRAWEGGADRLDRELRYGEPVEPEPGEWGDAAPRRSA